MHKVTSASGANLGPVGQYDMEPIVQNSGALTLPPRSISVISVQAPTELNTKHLY